MITSYIIMNKNIVFVQGFSCIRLRLLGGTQIEHLARSCLKDESQDVMKRLWPAEIYVPTYSFIIFSPSLLFHVHWSYAYPQFLPRI
jgi:hypothetical protein